MPQVFPDNQEDHSNSKAASDDRQPASKLARSDAGRPVKRNTLTDDPVAVSQGDPRPEFQDLPTSLRRHVDDYSEVMRDEVVSTNPFAAFAPKPVAMHFESQDEDEHIILLVRRHPITNLRWIVIALILGTFPLFLQIVPLITFFPPNFQIMTVIGWYLLILGYILERFFTWFFNVNIVTDERIVDIDFLSLLYKRISSAKIDKIEDVTDSVGGFIGSILNFGDVEIQTAAEQREFVFEQVPQPHKITKLLNEMILEEEREKIEGRIR